MQKHYPLIQAQVGIFRDWEAHPESLRYNLPSVARFNKGEVDGGRLQQALQTIIRQRAVLHTRFFLDSDGLPRQYADPSLAIPVVIHHMTEKEVQAYIAQDFVRPFHLLSGEPLCRLEIAETSEAVYLLIDFHHSIADGLTIASLLMHRDLPLAYDGQPLPPDSMALYEQGEREQSTFASQAYQKAAQYHRNRFADVAFSVLDTHLFPSSEGIKRSIIPYGILPHQGGFEGGLFLAAFALVLSKYTHSLQVGFSVLVHGRSGRWLRQAYGMFVESLPLCITIDNQLSARDFIKQVQHELTAALRHRVYPISHLYRDLKKRPSVVFGFQGPNIIEKIHLDGKPAQSFQLHQEETLSDSCLVYATGDGGYEVRGIMAKGVAECARNLALQPEAPLSYIAMQTPEEEAEMRALAQGPTMDFDEGETVVDMILRQARLTPDRTAIVDENGSITYGQLERLSAEVAKSVSQPFVCLPTSRSLQFVVSALGIMRAGAAYVPLDEAWPEQRRRMVREQVDATPSCQEPAAYMIFTSGTTGEPKGIVIPHRALTNLVHFLVREWGITSESRISCHSSFAFNASVEDIFPVLTVGGTLFIPNETERHDLRQMYQFLERYHITGGCYTTQFGSLLAQHYPLHVSYLCLGGEKLYPFTPCVSATSSPGSSNGRSAAVPPYRIFNTYGPTEFTVDATFHEMAPRSWLVASREDIPIGRPLPNCAAYVVDPQGRLVPRGVVGELLLAGRQMALNVQRNSPLASFLTSPSYPTGDLVRWNNDGELEFVGRKDRLLKHRGYRINPAEIEQALIAVPDIEAAAVRLESTHLVAYYQAVHPIDNMLLRRQLTTLLPAYMLPSRFIHLTSLPLNGHGKIDWARLSPTVAHPSFLTPRSPLPVLFARILQLDAVGPDDDFFDLGGTSLDAMLLVEELRKAGFSVSYGDIFNYPTPRAMALRLKLSTEDKEMNQGSVSNQRKKAATLLCSQDCQTEPSPLEGIRGGVILTGATGFLGCHILHELLTGQKEVSTIVCVVRGSSEQEARERLQSAYQHYFSASPFDDDARVVVVDGDITDSQTYFHLSLLTPHPSPLFIHCAADVRYFAPHQEIERTNIVGTRLVAEFCLRNNIRLTHISTLSVLHANGLHSSYITSKKEAEAYITRLTGQRLQAQIIRLGILAPRSTDGLFQRNADQSLFFSLLRLFGQLRAYPASIAHITPDVMPVDQAASAITGHALHPNTCNICINLTQPTPWKSLLAQATEMADNRFFELLCQYNDTPFATLPSIDRNTICSILQSYINNLR